MLTTDCIFPKLLQYMVFVNKGVQERKGAEIRSWGASISIIS